MKRKKKTIHVDLLRPVGISWQAVHDFPSYNELLPQFSDIIQKNSINRHTAFMYLVINQQNQLVTKGQLDGCARHTH